MAPLDVLAWTAHALSPSVGLSSEPFGRGGLLSRRRHRLLCRLAPPLLLLTLVVGTLAGGEAFAERIVTAAGDVLTPAASTLLEDALTSGPVAVVRRLGVGVTLWTRRGVSRTGYGLQPRLRDGRPRLDCPRNRRRAGRARRLGIALVGLGIIGAFGTVLGVQVALGGLALVPVLAVAFLPLSTSFPTRR